MNHAVRQTSRTIGRALDLIASLVYRRRAPLAPLSFVLSVELTPERRLAHVDAQQVRAALSERGFFLQLPPSPAQVLAALIQRDDG